jgi:hypothetical protein
MKNKKLKRLSLISLLTGYTMCVLFTLLVIFNRAPEAAEVTVTEEIEYADDLFNGVHKENIQRERFYVGGHPVDRLTVIDGGISYDRSAPVILNDPPNTVVIRDEVALHGRDNDLIIGEFNNETHVKGHRVGGSDNIHALRDVHGVRDGTYGLDQGGVGGPTNREIDRGLLDRRINELDEAFSVTKGKKPVDDIKEFGIDDADLLGLTLARDGGDVDFELDADLKEGEGYGLKKGELYAYDFPSQGVGAGIGSSAVGAGVGGGAGIGGGIGEAVLQGQTVPTLGGVGTSSAMPLEGQAEGAPPTDGVGGLVGGAGAGGAAGLVVGTVANKLGLGIGVGDGIGTGGDGAGAGGACHFEHLPKDGALYIMMHVDGSGSILNTRKQLDIMKDTLLKDALLPYYNNDENLYNRRVLIVDGNGERTLQFFTEASKKENVLAVVFQDEAQPAYHLPTFNKKPQDHYSKDLGKLKASLNGYGGIYRGVMFQTDRGRTFAKSFKEFVECAWRGEGYLKNDSLKKYYWENNQHHIKNKNGIVFSDIYHAKDEGDPQYYLDLIFEASKKVGLDLDIYGAGLSDGKRVRPLYKD